MMTGRNQSRRTLRTQNASPHIEVDFSTLQREAEQDVMNYMRRKGWLGSERSSLSTEKAYKALLKHLPEIIETVPDALWSRSVYRTLLLALRIVQHPYMRLEPEIGPVTNLILLAEQPSRLPPGLRPFVHGGNQVVEAALLALKAASILLNRPPIRKTVLGDLATLIRKRAHDSSRKLQHVMDEVAALLELESGDAVAKNQLTKRVNALNSMLRRGQERRL